MVGAGVTHFVATAAYQRIVPRWAGDTRRVVLVSGAAELVCGTLLLNRRTGRLGACLTTALLVVVFPANVQMALDAGTEQQAVPDMPAGRFRSIAMARPPRSTAPQRMRRPPRSPTTPRPSRSNR